MMTMTYDLPLIQWLLQPLPSRPTPIPSSPVHPPHPSRNTGDHFISIRQAAICLLLQPQPQLGRAL